MWESKQFLCEMVNDLYIFDKKLKKGLDGISHTYNSQERFKKVFLDITNKCNIKCEHCFTNAEGNSDMDEMNTSEIKKLFDQLAEFKVERVALGGGEPLVRNDIYEVIRYGTDLGIRIHMSSNGLMLTQNTIEKLKQSGLDSVQISIDSKNEQTHDTLRRCPGLFKKCLEAVGNVRKAGIPLIISTTITKLNIEELEDTIEMVRGLGVKMHRLIRFVPVGRGEHYKNKLYVEPQVLIPYMKKIRQRYQEYFFGNEELIFGIPIDNGKLEKTKVFENPNGCEAGKLCVDILPSGVVVPCNYLGWDPRWVGGNVKEKPFWRIVNESKIIEYFREQDGRNIEECSECPVKNQCGKGCRAVAYNYYGDVKKRDPYCIMIGGV